MLLGDSEGDPVGLADGIIDGLVEGLKVLGLVDGLDVLGLADGLEVVGLVDGADHIGLVVGLEAMGEVVGNAVGDMEHRFGSDTDSGKEATLLSSRSKLSPQVATIPLSNKTTQAFIVHAMSMAVRPTPRFT